MAQVRHFVDPESVWTELKNAAPRGFLDQRQSERVAIERDRLIVSMMRTFNGDIRTAGELRTVDIGNHIIMKRGATWLKLGHNLLRDCFRFFHGSFVIQPGNPHRDQRIAFDDVEHHHVHR